MEKSLKSIIAAFLFISSLLPASFVYSEESAPQKAQPEYPFVEIVYDFDVHSLKNHPVESHGSPEKLSGYFLRYSPSEERPKLYPATGRPFAAPAKETVFVGYSLQNHTDHVYDSYQSLKEIVKNVVTIDTGKEPDGFIALNRMGILTLIRPGVEVTVKQKDGGDIEIKAQGKTVLVKAGETKEIFTAEETASAGEWINRLVEAVKKLGIDEKSIDPSALRNDFYAFAPAGENVTFYFRISAVHHGNVQLAGIDVLAEWEKAKDKLQSGPYSEAKTSLQNVISAAPEHKDALQLYDQVITLEAQGKKACRVQGKLEFPAGTPDEKLKEFWKKYHPGIAALGRPDGKADSAITTSPVEDGAFTLFIPSGSYQLIVTVPGFEEYRQAINVEGNMEINVPLKQAA